MGSATGKASRNRKDNGKEMPAGAAARAADQARKEDEALDWMQVDPETFKGTLANSYGALQKARALASEKRDEFQDTFTAEARKAGSLEEGKGLLFAYRFGQLHVAMVDASQIKKRGQAKQKKTFSIGG